MKGYRLVVLMHTSTSSFHDWTDCYPEIIQDDAKVSGKNNAPMAHKEIPAELA
jgi:hypothetical protein